MNPSSDGRRPLRVAINCPFVPGQGLGGIETFVMGLLHALGRLDDDQTEYIVVGPPDDPEWMRPFLGANQRIVSQPRHRRPRLSPRVKATSLVEQVSGRQVPVSNGFLESLGCDVVHFPYQHYVICALPSVYNPHDLQYFYYPQYFTPADVAWREKVDHAACRFATAIAVSSRWVKRDLIRHFAAPPDKIHIIPDAPPTQAYAEPTAAQIDEVRTRYAVQEPFAFYPAMTWEHKNHVRLLEAVARLRDDQGLAIQVICTGHQNRFWPQVKACLDALNLERQVRFLGMVPAVDLRAIYRLAQFVVIPTLFEASSAPLLEAWHDGAPTACSTVTALPEQAGDAALLFDPLSVEAMAGAMARLATDANLRDELRRKGRARLQRFTWDRAARGYRAAYRRSGARSLNEDDHALLADDWSRQDAVETPHVD